MKVKIYKNLNNGMFSIVALEGEKRGMVIGYANSVVLKNVTFRVSQAGRARVLAERQKNVHAFVVGELHTARGYVPRLITLPCDLMRPVDVTGDVFVRYDPYKYTSFVALNDLSKPDEYVPVSGADTIYMNTNHLVADGVFDL